ncbi:hypothetical protein FACS189499_00920 [Clostridia bacterium]|nr:hypothetical protein FACS189499_00920 [Clostridia bacterium]
MSNPYAAYKKQTVQTMTPIELIVKLYDALERELNRGIHFIEEKDFEKANNSLKHALELTEGLEDGLDLKYDIGGDLYRIYNFLCNEILLANTKKDADIIRNLLPQISELKDAFVQISKMSKEQIAIQDEKR